MTTIDDAAIQKRAKQLCRDDGIAWDWFGAKSGARVLSDRDRRECLMRAREELIAEAETRASQEQTFVDHTTGERDQVQVPPDQSVTFWPRRRVA